MYYKVHGREKNTFVCLAKDGLLFLSLVDRHLTRKMRGMVVLILPLTGFFCLFVEV